MAKQKSLTDVFHASGRKMFTDALRETWGGDLLDEIPSYGPDGNPPGAKAWKEGLSHIGSAPKSKEIDYRRTEDDLLMDGVAVLKDGRRVSW